MIQPDRKLIASLRKQVRSIEDSFERNTPGEPWYESIPTRLEDELYHETKSTPFGDIPVYAHDMGTIESVPSLPRELALLWDIPDGRINAAISLDIETSGPLGGSGGIPFVLGMGTLRDGSIHLEQIILRSPDDEMAALWYLEQCVRQNDVLLTYNGTRFDFPILRKRFRTFGTPWDETNISRCRSIDLEGFIRSIHIPNPEGAKLTELEKYILSVYRPLWSWHEIWRGASRFDVSRKRKLARVLSKNGYDSSSLFHLLNATISMVEDPGQSIDKLGLFLGRKLRSHDSELSLTWFRNAAMVTGSSKYAVKASLEAWSVASDTDRQNIFASALRKGISDDVPGAWKAAERLGLHEWRCGNAEDAEFWTELSFQLEPPVRSRERLVRRLNRYRRHQSSDEDV